MTVQRSLYYWRAVMLGAMFLFAWSVVTQQVWYRTLFCMIFFLILLGLDNGGRKMIEKAKAFDIEQEKKKRVNSYETHGIAQIDARNPPL